MYLLSNLVLVNWHNFEPVELPFARCTAVIGENRSGKSTLLDAIQVGLLGNHGQWRELNRAAADERSRRTVRNYCLGMLAAGQAPLRESALTWIGLHFRDEESGHDVSIALNLTASLHDTSEQTNRLVLPGYRLRLSDLCDAYEEDGSSFVQPLDWETATGRLAKRIAGIPGAALLTPSGPERYMAEFMKAMSVGGRSPQPRTLAKAFVNAVAYREVASDDQFFKRFLLPEKPIDIAQLRTAIATYREVDAQIKRLRSEIGLLREAAREGERHLAALAEAEAEDWMSARAEAQLAWRQLRRNRARLAERQRQAEMAADEHARAREELAEARAELDDLRARLHQSSAGQLRQIELEEERIQRQRADAERELAAWGTLIRDALQVAGDGLLAGSGGLSALSDGLKALAPLAGGDGGFPRDPAGLRRALEALGPLAPAAAHLDRIARQAWLAEEQARQRRDEALTRLKRLRDGQAPVGEEVLDFMRALRAEGMEPELLCALVTVTDEGWRDAAEALLGAERETIILPPEQVERAIRYWREQRGRYRRCRVARTDKVAPESRTPQPGTMAAIVRTEHPLVAGYLRRRIGEVRLAETVEALRAPGRAIMRDCMYDDGLSVRRLFSNGPPLLGRAVGAAAEEHLAREAEQLAGEAEAAAREARRHAAASRALQALAEALTGGRQPVDLLDEARARAAERLEALRQQRRKVEDSIAPDWTAEAARLERQVASLQETCDESAAERTRAQTEADQIRRQLGDGDDAPGSVLHFRLRLRQLRQANGRVPAVPLAGLPGRAELRRRFRERLERLQGEPKSVAHEARQKGLQHKSAAAAARDAFWSRVEEYRRRIANPQSEHLQSTRMPVAEAVDWISGRIAWLQDHALLEHETQMERASREMTKAFQTDFVAAVRDRMEIVAQEVDRICAILRPHSFHQERYRFRHRTAAEYEGVIRLAQLAADDPARLMSLFDEDRGEAPADPSAHDEAVEQVKRLLLSEELDPARFEDYRNYWTFWLESAQVGTDRWVSFQSRKGTGSGAESQTPFYIAMAAALAAAYRGGREARTGGMGLALFDEAFSKMDPNNQRRMLDFFVDIGLQPVVAAPLSGQTALVSRMDRILEVWRSGDRAEVETYAPGPQLRLAIEREDPSRLTREQLMAIAEETGETGEPPLAGVAE